MNAVHARVVPMFRSMLIVSLVLLSPACTVLDDAESGSILADTVNGSLQDTSATSTDVSGLADSSVADAGPEDVPMETAELGDIEAMDVDASTVLDTISDITAPDEVDATVPDVEAPDIENNDIENMDLITDAMDVPDEDIGSGLDDVATDVLDPDACTPTCEGKNCGKDGCGGSCGECSEGETCSGGQCQCVPDCLGKTCGTDGCGGSCGACDDGNPCTDDACWEGSCTADESALDPCISPPCAVNNRCLYKVDRGALTSLERLVAISLQGVTSQHRPAIWMSGSGLDIYPDDLSSTFGVTFVKDDNVWSLVERLGESLNGYILFDANTSSQSVAMSLSGLLGALAVPAPLEGDVQALGLALNLDVRGKDEAWCWSTYGGQFNGKILAEQKQDEQFGAFLLDFPIAQKAFIYFDEACGDFRTQIALQMAAPLIYGWGQECGEYEFAKGASEGGASVVPADWSSNLSVLSNVVNANVTGNHHAPDALTTDDEAHYVAFVMSDGDNIQFMQNAFNDARWWGSVHRGDFPMGWEMSPILKDASPSILQWLYQTATDNDQMVSGPSGSGYAFPSVHADALALAQKSVQDMKDTDMRVTTVLNTGGGLEAGDVFVQQDGIDGVIYKDFSDYNGLKGALRWTNGKPIMAFRYLLWNNGSVEDSPSGVASAINAAPKAPKTDIGSYSVVNIHAWSEWPANPYGSGAFDAAKWTVELLGPHVKVVSPEELLAHLMKHLQGVTTPPKGPSLVFEAESDLSHQMGYPDGEGWACNTADQEAGHMCYGPYATEISAGSHTATFRLMIDVTGPPASNDKVVTLDVYDANTGTYLAMKALDRYDFNAPFTMQDFPLEFVNEAGSNLEFRVFWHATSYVNVDKVTIE